MKALLAAALALAAASAPCRAGELVQLSGARAAGPGAALGLYASPSPAWADALGPQLGRLMERFGAQGAPAVMHALAGQALLPGQFAARAPRERAERLLKAELSARADAQAQAAAALAELAGRPDPSSDEYPVLVSRLYMLQGPLARLVDGPDAARLAEAYRAARGRLDAAQQERFSRLLERAQRAFPGSEPGPTLFELTVAGLPRIPAGYMTARVAQLRGASASAPAWDHRLAPPLPPAPRSPGLRSRVAALRLRDGALRLASRGLYRPARDAFRAAMGELGEVWRKYVSGREVDRHNFRWGVLERLHKKGDFRGSFGHPVYDLMPEVMSPLIFREDALAPLRAQKRLVGRDLVIDGRVVPVRKVEYSPMIGVSGMSFPQLSAQSHLSLIYIHLKLAKELGVRATDNTGEGGPGFHLAVLEGDREKLRRYLVDWNKANRQFDGDPWGEAEVVHFVDSLMRKRDALFKEFTPQDLARAQVVAQFGSALNGIRAEGGFVDFDKLRSVADSPYVAMTQFKLKQAAKRGARVDPRKIDAVVAALREIPHVGKPFKSPELNPDFASYEDIAALVKASKLVTRKPVSLKFAVGDVKDLHDFLAFLKAHDALPDHIQLDGRGDDFSPGSGNAPPGANTSLPANDAVIVADAILKKLGVRGQVFLEATGDVLLPAEGVLKLALGADGLAGARVWMNMGLGCAKVKACADGNCPYGIASRSNSLVGLSLDPEKVAPKGFAAGSNWFKTYTQTLAETGQADWRTLRDTIGLGSRSTALRLKSGGKMLPLDRYYDLDYVSDLLRGALTRREVRKLVFRR